MGFEAAVAAALVAFVAIRMRMRQFDPESETRRLCLRAALPRPWCSRWIHGERRAQLDLFDDWLAGLDAAAAENGRRTNRPLPRRLAARTAMEPPPRTGQVLSFCL